MLLLSSSKLSRKISNALYRLKNPKNKPTQQLKSRTLVKVLPLERRFTSENYGLGLESSIYLQSPQSDRVALV